MEARSGARVYVVCSDQGRNGKTFLARLYTDHLLLAGRDPFVFDADHPRGSVARWFPERSEIVNLERTSGQMRLFDTMLSEPTRDYVVDVPDRGFETFFAVLDDIEFAAEAHRAGLELVILFVLDRAVTSLMAARDLRGAFQADTFFTVRNEYVGSIFRDSRSHEIYDEIAADGEIVIPAFDGTAQALTDDPQFSFRRFVETDGAGVPALVRVRIRAFLNEVFGQLSARQLSFDLDDLKGMGLI